MRGRWILAGALSLGALAYVRNPVPSATKLFRPDAMNIQFLLNGSMHPGFTNNDGNVILTASSNVTGALTAAEATWASIPTTAVGFLPLLPTTTDNDPTDGKHVITITDTAANRSTVGQFLAITLYRFRSDGTILDTDIIFNPKGTDSSGNVVSFSTDHAPGTYDLRSVVMHEMGHALGANHSGVIGATMYQNMLPFASFSTAAEATLSSTPGSDDIAFLTNTYPAPGAAAQLGSIAGTVSFQGGGPVLGALVNAIDPSTGIAIGGLSSLTDGTYTIASVPPGNYQVYAQPLNGPVMPANLNLTATQVTGAFRTTFSGGNASPAVVGVIAGNTASAEISVDPASSAISIAHLGVGSAGGNDWVYADLKSAIAGKATDVLLWGTGIDASVTPDQLHVLGPGVTVRAGTLHAAPNDATGGLTPIRFTVDIQPSASRAATAIGIVKGTDAAMRSSGLVILPNLTGPGFTAGAIVNAASFKSGAVAPGEMFTIFGSQFGPPQLAPLALSGSGRVSTSIGATRVYFDDVPAPLIYAAAGQVAGIVPYSVAGNATTNVRVEYNGVSSAAVSVPVAAASPAVFTLNSTGTGSGNGSGPGAIRNQDGSINTASNPAAIGSVIQIFGTGEGQTNPPGSDGLLAATAPFPAPAANLTVSIGGANADLLYAGTAPQSVMGFLQVNARVPAGIAAGSAVPVVVTVGGIPSPTVTVAVR